MTARSAEIRHSATLFNRLTLVKLAHGDIEKLFGRK